MPSSKTGEVRSYSKGDLKYDYRAGRFTFEELQGNYCHDLEGLFTAEEIDVLNAIDAEGPVCYVEAHDSQELLITYALVKQDSEQMEYAMAVEVSDPDNPTLAQAKRSADWPKWKAAIEKEYQGITDGFGGRQSRHDSVVEIPVSYRTH